MPMHQVNVCTEPTAKVKSDMHNNNNSHAKIVTHDNYDNDTMQQKMCTQQSVMVIQSASKGEK